MTEAEVVNHLEDMATIEATNANAGALEVLTSSMAEFETRLGAQAALAQDLFAQLEVSQAMVVELQSVVTDLQSANTATDANIQTLATDITAIKGTATAVRSTETPAPIAAAVPVKPTAITNTLISERLKGVKIGSFATARNFQHN